MSKHRIHFPHEIQRFTGLQGGQYGTADLVALTRHDLEFRLGGDYVEFTRASAVELRNAIDRFLALECEEDHGGERHHHHHRHDDDDRVEVIEKIEEKVEVVEQVRERGTRRKRA